VRLLVWIQRRGFQTESAAFRRQRDVDRTVAVANAILETNHCHCRAQHMPTNSTKQAPTFIVTLLTLSPLDGARDGAGGTVGRVIDGGEQIGVGVLDVHALRKQSHFDLAALVADVFIAGGLREPDDHPSDPIGEPREGQSQAALHVDAKHVRYDDIVIPNLNLRHPAILSR
jgi:hypothetical protein